MGPFGLRVQLPAYALRTESLCQETLLDPLKLKCPRDKGTQASDRPYLAFADADSDQHGVTVFTGDKTAARSRKQAEGEEMWLLKQTFPETGS